VRYSEELAALETIVIEAPAIGKKSG
jgi:hypothetical protein